MYHTFFSKSSKEIHTNSVFTFYSLSKAEKSVKYFHTILGIIAEGGNIRDFGFNIEGSLRDHWVDVLGRKAGLMSFKSEEFIHWPHIKRRMLENYENIEDKEFVDWFLNFDFDKAKRQGLIRYYRQNFFSILKRKLKFSN